MTPTTAAAHAVGSGTRPFDKASLLTAGDESIRASSLRKANGCKAELLSGPQVWGQLYDQQAVTEVAGVMWQNGSGTPVRCLSKRTLGNGGYQVNENGR